MNKRSKGGNITPAHAAARVNIAKKCALVAVETPKATNKPEIVKATNLDSALKQLDVNFKVLLRRMDGSTSREELKIESLDDFEEATIVNNSEVLREQKLRMEFLHEFQNELRHNPVFRAELQMFLEGQNREKMIKFLKGWLEQFKKPSSEFMAMLCNPLNG